MTQSGLVRIHWSKDGKQGEGAAPLPLNQESCELDIEIDPVNAAPLWIDLAPAPALLRIAEIQIIGSEGKVLRHLADPDELRRLATGPSAWWTTDSGDARLLALGEENLFSIDLPEGSDPAHRAHLRIALVLTGDGSSLAQAMGELLLEARREHELFAEQIGSLLAWQQARRAQLETGKRQVERKRRWGFGQRSATL